MLDKGSLSLERGFIVRPVTMDHLDQDSLAMCLFPSVSTQTSLGLSVPFLNVAT